MPFGPGTYGRRRRPGQGAVSNTGTRSTSTQTTGATGAVTNTVRITATPGSPGQAGTVTPRTPPPEEVEARTLADNAVNEARKTARDAAEGAFARAEASLAMHRERVLGAVPREYHDQVNAAFDRGHEAIGRARQRRRG